MTDSEQYYIIGKIVSDHENAKRNLAMLRAKGKEMADRLNGLSNALSDHATFEDHGSSGFRTKNKNSGTEVSGVYPTWDDVRSLLVEIKTTQAQILDLESRRKELGV